MDSGAGGGQGGSPPGFYEALQRGCVEAVRRWLDGLNPRPPGAAEHVFLYFKELDRVRPTGYSPGPIDFQQLESWSRLRGVTLRNWEISAILRMDRARLERHYAAKKSPAEESGEHVVSERPLTTQLFDALFQ